MNRLLRLVRKFASDPIRRELERTTVRLEEHRAELGEVRRSTKVLSALDRAAAAMASGTSEANIYEAATKTLHELGFQTTVVTLDEKRERLHVRYLDMDQALLRRAEELAGIRKEDFSFAPDATEFHRAIVLDEQTVFCDDAVALAIQVLPGVPSPVVRTVCRLVGVSRLVGSPLVVDGEVIGLVAVSGPNLTAHDVPVVRLFSQQLGAALSKARLVEDLQRSMEELKQTQEQLSHAQKIEAVGLLASGVAHDFNNLLSAITLSARLVESEVEDSDAKDDLQVIQESCARGAALVAQLMALGKKQALNVSIFDVDGLMHDLQRLLCRVLGEDVRVTLDLGVGEKFVKGDRNQLEQVLVNLAANARDAMPTGGELCISTKLETGHGSNGDPVPGPSVRIRVRDTGTGMSQATRDRIFDPFFTTKGVGRGTGLGLSVAKAIMQSHGGDIVVEACDSGPGTTFSLALPRVQASRTEAAAAPSDDTALGGSELVLVVEDDPLVLRSAARVLDRAGYRVLTAVDAAAARALVHEHGREIGLVVCDVGLPDGRGPALLEDLIPQLPDTRVLLASGYMAERSERALLDEHGWHFLPKPYSGAELLQVARRLLD